MRPASQISKTSRIAAAKAAPSDNSQCRWVLIKKALLELNPSEVYKLSKKSTIFHIFFTSPTGSAPSDPIRLSGHNVEQFRDLLWAAQLEPLPDPQSTPLPRLLSVAELSFKYQLKSLSRWSMEGLRRLASNPTSTKIRYAPDISLGRLLKLSILYQQSDLSTRLQEQWLTRVYRQELSPFAAITVGDKCGLPQFVGHAMYIHMVDMASRIADSERIDLGSPLTHSQNLHIFCGYYSLRAYWRQLSQCPPSYSHSPECRYPSKCSAAWIRRWKACSSSELSAHPDVDVQRKLLELQRRLSPDLVLRESMPAGCRAGALNTVTQKRNEVSNNLHHHFDI
ncbi:hypothetical protein E1B28_012087 [Marasmius oreades]|uniref:Uncharacterized protein n=1 Tax=Marasmius oreades TaxID=181124 RepID=A0A9P7UQE7_9AGAR|nr:uncharacterized protein E1B28_012087 [Marasmius oreades]KAG7088054.1 hypothetical protein E1B28_012087 [Marasmius oreades]